jgi:hypothetical protein
MVPIRRSWRLLKVFARGKKCLWRREAIMEDDIIRKRNERHCEKLILGIYKGRSRDSSFKALGNNDSLKCHWSSFIGQAFVGWSSCSPSKTCATDIIL